MEKLKTFDAFSKTQQQHLQRSSRGGWSSIFMYIFLLFVAWTEFGSFFGGYVDRHYFVDEAVTETAQINLDLFIKLPCKWIDVNSIDQTQDRMLAQELLSFEDMPFFVPLGYHVNKPRDIKTSELDEILAGALPAEFRKKLDIQMENTNGCHIFGSIPVNKVGGQLLFTAKGYGYRDGQTPFELLDFSHVINEFSFGEFFPYLENPLDSTAKLTQEKITQYSYRMSVVPTTYNKLGAEVHTNQYSLSESTKSFPDKSGRIPGIFFNYSFEGLSMMVEDHRISFLQFVTRLVTILSVIVYLAGWFFRGADKLYMRFYGKHLPRNGLGILDQLENGE